MVRTFGVVPDEPVDESVVEAIQVISEEAAMVLNEVFGERPVEAFDVGVHLGAARIGIEVRDTESDAGIVEQVGELASVVGLYLGDIKGCNDAELREKIGGGS